MAPRITLRGKYNYHTKSNKIRRFRTPGGKLSYHVVNKVRNPVVCGDTGVVLNGIKRLNKNEWRNAPKRVRIVSRTYGGVLSAEAVRHRIMRAFFNEELKAVKNGIVKAAKSKKKQKGGQKGKPQKKKDTK